MTQPEKKAFEFFQEYPGHLKTATDDIADRLNLTYEEVAEGRRQYRKRNKDNDGGYDDYDKKENHDNNNQNRGYKKGNTPTALKDQTLKEYCESVGIDFDKIDPYNDVKYWTDGMGNRRYSIVPKKLSDEDFDPVQVFKESVSEYSPPSYSDTFSHSTKIVKDRIAFLNLFDAHIDKICSIDVTDSEASIDKNIKEFEEAFDELLTDVQGKAPEKIVIPFGNDFFQTNDFTLSTKRGTPQADKVHTTGHEAFRIGINLIRKCVDKARHIAPVVLLPVRGNHDEDRVRYMLECLLIAYENQEDVAVRDTRRARNYIQYGSWLFGFAHGDKGIKVKEYPQLMSTDKESRKYWSMIDQGVFFLGHIHHEKRYEYLKGKDFRGCKVEVLRATSPMDEWHWEEGYTAIPRTAYAFVYDKDGQREHELKVTI